MTEVKVLKENPALSISKSPRPLWARCFLLLSFLVTVNLVSGLIAIEFGYPSLWGATVQFHEYALPIGMTWAFAHWPSMLAFGLPLLVVHEFSEDRLRNYRWLCLAVFLLTLLELDEKIPFVLFPKVDSLLSLLFSLIAAPPNRAANPVMVRALKVIGAFVSAAIAIVAYSSWRHRTPKIDETELMGGLFELVSIEVRPDLRKEMEFTVDLKKHVPDQDVCDSSRLLAATLMQEYPFDRDYQKIFRMRFNPHAPRPNFEPYEIAVLETLPEPFGSPPEIACFRSSALLPADQRQN